MAQGQIEKAVRLIERGRKLLDSWDNEAEIDRAEKLFRQAVTLAPDQGEGWRGLGDVCWENEEFTQAIEAYQRAHTLGIDNAALWRRLATAFISLPNAPVAESLAAIDRALRLAPAERYVLGDFIEVFAKFKLWDQPKYRAQALSVVDRAQALAPDDVFVQANAVTILIALGQRDPAQLQRALAEIERLIVTPVPDQFKVWKLNQFVLYSGLLAAEGRIEEALTVTARLIELATEIKSVASAIMWRRAFARRATLLVQMGSFDDALTSLEQYLNAEKRPELIWRTLYAELLLHVGRAPEALEKAETLLSDAESQAFTYPLHVYAQILSALGREDEAIIAEQQAKIRPNHTTPLDMLLPSL